MPIEACLAAIASFAKTCEADRLVLAAFLGGSFASGRATETRTWTSTSSEDDYPRLWDERARFVAAMGEPELAYAHTGNFPYEVLVDRTGLLDGVTFPLL